VLFGGGSERLQSHRSLRFFEVVLVSRIQRRRATDSIGKRNYHSVRTKEHPRNEFEPFAIGDAATPHPIFRGVQCTLNIPRIGWPFVLDLQNEGPSLSAIPSVGDSANRRSGDRECKPTAALCSLIMAVSTTFATVSRKQTRGKRSVDRIRSSSARCRRASRAILAAVVERDAEALETATWIRCPDPRIRRHYP